VRAVLLALAGLLLVAGCSSGPSDGAFVFGGTGGRTTVVYDPPEARGVLPAVTGESLLEPGRPLSSQDVGGQVVVLNVWGSWCGPCRKEAPALQAASEQTKDIAQFIGINTKDRSEAPAVAFVRANRLTYPSIYDPDGKTLLAFAGDLPPSAIPSTLIIDTQGRLAVRVLGDISTITLVAMINDVANGT
jgi:thiol-disulfide isomerase/thioredoxin